jgi:polyhydroxybutyrate depolymerase
MPSGIYPVWVVAKSAQFGGGMQSTWFGRVSAFGVAAATSLLACACSSSGGAPAEALAPTAGRSADRRTSAGGPVRSASDPLPNTPSAPASGEAPSDAAGSGIGFGAGVPASAAAPEPNAAPTSPIGNPNVTCPAKSQRGPGQYTDRMLHDGDDRTFLIQIPPAYDGTQALPLVFDFHGLRAARPEGGPEQARISGWRELGNRESIIVVHPNGIGVAWNGGSCCGNAGIDDVGFVRAMAQTIAAEFCVDPKRIYATGLSNGGAMSHRLGCEAADLIAAVAPASMGGLSMCNPSRPITVVEFRGTRDDTVLYDGGGFRSAMDDFEAWKTIDGCDGAPVESEDGVCQTYDRCEDGVTVTLCSPMSGHVIYTSDAAGSNIAEIAWPIFRAHPLP